MNILSLKRLVNHFVFMCGDGGGGGDGGGIGESGGFGGDDGAGTGTSESSIGDVASDDGTTASVDAAISEGNAADASWGGEGNTTSTTGGAVGGVNGVSDVSSESLGNAPASNAPATMSEETAQNLNDNLTAIVNFVAPTALSLMGVPFGSSITKGGVSGTGTLGSATGGGDDETPTNERQLYSQAPVTGLINSGGTGGDVYSSAARNDAAKSRTDTNNQASQNYQSYIPQTAVPIDAGVDASMYGDGSGWGSSIQKYTQAKTAPKG